MSEWMNEWIECLGQGHVWMRTPKHFNSESEKKKWINERRYCKSVTKIACYYIVTLSDYNITCHLILFRFLWLLLFFSICEDFFFCARFVGF